ncbi:glycosyltransferase [uncultured Sunxiuqinia sp.]|uniref:glycosyltransferase n=1 Tax=uncultured Sunxiuqinia sp. TaxID=1573825 RepID=UPI002AA749A2|nr:glycosyltransferase [uncultured Sunxiuqinia sp.]
MILDFFNRIGTEWIASGIFFFSVLIELFFLLFFYLRLLFQKRVTDTTLEMPMSICMCVRNEEEQIEEVLTRLLKQNYSNFEIILVDDFSEDCTIQKVAQLAEKYPKLKFTSINQETNFSEKLAINLAMKAASSEQMIMLPPDIGEIDPNFLKKMNDLSDESDFLINYSNIIPQKKFINKLIRIERFLSFLNSAAYSLAGIPVFFNETNVLFKKTVYFQQSGFRGKMNCHFGNLELIFNDRFKKKVHVSIEPETFVRENATLQKGDFSGLLKKKIRLNQQLGFEKRLIQWLENFGKLTLMISLTWMLVTESANWLFVSIPMAVLIGLQVFIIKRMTTHLRERKIFLSSLAYVYVRPVLYFVRAFEIYLYDKRIKSNKWN